MNRVSFESLADPDAFARRVLFENNRLLVVDKPPGLATMGLPEGEPTLFSFAKRYIKIKYQKPGNVYLGVVSRLDVPVSGVVVFARTSKAAARLNEQFRARTTTKIYRAVVEGFLDPPEGEAVDFICENERERRVWVARPSASEEYLRRIGAKEARLTYRTLERGASTSLVEIELGTGRKHQIRLQLANRNAPIVGDGKYGARPIPDVGIALHATRLTLVDPATGEPTTFESLPPPSWRKFLRGSPRRAFSPN